MNKKGFTPHFWTYSKNNKKNEYNKGAGFTLMEILVAALIMALVMTGLANVFVAAKRHILHSRSRMVVGELGRYFLDPFQMQVRQDTWSTSCLGTGTAANCPNETVGTAQGLDRDYTAHYTVTHDFNGTNLSKVKVDITWTEPSS